MIAIRNWSKFQHYGSRNPPWIKVYRDLLDDPDWHELSDEAKAFLLELWLVASKLGTDGNLPDDNRVTALHLRRPLEDFERLLSECNHWLILDASNVLAGCKQGASKVLAFPSDSLNSNSTSNSKSLRDREENASKVLASPAKGAYRCPQGYAPTPECRDALRSEGFSDSEIDRAVLSMRDWSLSGDKRKKDWDATLRNWLRRDAKPAPKTKTRSAMERNLERNR